MTLFFYILKEYIKYVVGTVILTLFLFVLFDFIHKTTKYFAEYQPSSDKIIQFYVYSLPNQFTQALPIASLLASVIAMILLSRTNEITAMRAAGMGPLQLGLPLAAGGMLLSILSFFIGEAVVPRTAAKTHYIKEVLIEQESDIEIAEGARWLRDGESLFNFNDYDPISRVLTGVRLIDIRSNFKPKELLEADHANYVEEESGGIWELSGIRVSYFNTNGTLHHTEQRPNQVLALPVEPKKLKKERRKPNELSIRELHELIERGEASGVDTLPFRVDYHMKFSYPFAAFVVCLVGLRFGYKSERATETAKGVLLAFGLGLSYWFILSSARALGMRGSLHPLPAAWLANFAILGLIFLDGFRSRRL